MQQSEIAQILIGDPLADCLTRLIKQYNPYHILDIGASDGTGSTLVMHSAGTGEIYALELTNERYKSLCVFASDKPRIYPYRYASVGLEGLMPKEYIRQFHRSHSRFNLWRDVGLQYMLTWYDETIEAIKDAPVQEGIKQIKIENGIKDFDLVLIDGGPFTGAAELSEVYGAGIIVMDDVKDLKCFDAYLGLKASTDYELIEQNLEFRNGYAVFKK